MGILGSGLGSTGASSLGLGASVSNLNMDLMLPGPLWDSYSTILYPRTLRDALYWANWLKTRFGDYGSAIRRAVSYFMGGIDLVGDSLDVESREMYTKDLIQKHDLLSKMIEIGTDLQFNGNVFLSCFAPVTRVLICPHCGAERYLESMIRGTDYDFVGGDFTSTCDACHKSGVQIAKCRPAGSRDGRPLNLISWSPLDISIDYCSITDTERITWTPGYNDKRFLEDSASSAALQSLPDTILNAIVHDEAILFKGNGCIHLRKSTDALNRSLVNGWGLPGWLPGFKYVVLLMLLERQLEAGAKDFILPLRLLYPLPQEKTGSDPMGGQQFSMKLSALRNQLTTALQAQSVKQASWHMVSTPIGSMQLGGDAKALVPVDILEYVNAALLNTQCVPSEFHKPSLQIGASSPPVSLRMFEQTWRVDANTLDYVVNTYLGWCSELLNWPKMEGSLLKPSIADDPVLVNVLMQGHAEGAISNATFYRRFNIDPRMEHKRIMEEQIQSYKDSIEMEKIQEQLGFTAQALSLDRQNAMSAGMAAAQDALPPEAGGAPVEGAPQGGGEVAGTGVIPAPQGGDASETINNMVSMQQQNVSIEQLQADAQEAAQIIVRTPVGAQRSRLYTMIRDKNKTLHAMVRQMVETMERGAAQKGIEMQRAGELPE